MLASNLMGRRRKFLDWEAGEGFCRHIALGCIKQETKGLDPPLKEIGFQLPLLHVQCIHT